VPFLQHFDWVVTPPVDWSAPADGEIRHADPVVYVRKVRIEQGPGPSTIV
jgi:hypothetical protein